jgi:hypothetical protein
MGIGVGRNEFGLKLRLGSYLLLPLEVGQVIESGKRPLLGENVRHGRTQAGLNRPCKLHAQVEGELGAPACV